MPVDQADVTAHIVTPFGKDCVFSAGSMQNEECFLRVLFVLKRTASYGPRSPQFTSGQLTLQP